MSGAMFSLIPLWTIILACCSVTISRREYTPEQGLLLMAATVGFIITFVTALGDLNLFAGEG